MTLFNTIVPPNSPQFVFNQCRYICTGCFLRDADHSDITNASSYHPGGGTRAVLQRFGALRHELDYHANLVGTRHEELR